MKTYRCFVSVTNKYAMLAALLAITACFGCASDSTPKSNNVRRSALSLSMPAAGKSKVVFFRPHSGIGGEWACEIFDGAQLAGILESATFFEYECEPGAHLFSGMTAHDLKPMESELLPNRIYYVKMSIRANWCNSGVNLYSLYPGFEGNSWSKIPKELAGVKEHIVSPDEAAEWKKDAAKHLAKVEKLRDSRNDWGRIKPDDGQNQPLTDQ